MPKSEYVPTYYDIHDNEKPLFPFILKEENQKKILIGKTTQKEKQSEEKAKYLIRSYWSDQNAQIIEDTYTGAIKQHKKNLKANAMEQTDKQTKDSDIFYLWLVDLKTTWKISKVELY